MAIIEFWIDMIEKAIPITESEYFLHGSLELYASTTRTIPTTPRKKANID